MKAIEELKAAYAAATPGGLYPSVEEVRLLCGTPDFTLYSQLLEHAPALIECAEVLAEVRSESGWNSDTWDRAHAALAKLENNNA